MKDLQHSRGTEHDQTRSPNYDALKNPDSLSDVPHNGRQQSKNPGPPVQRAQENPQADLQRKEEDEVDKVQAKLEGGGQSLGGETKGNMEKAFGADFTGVKLHTGSKGNEVAQGQNARAVTVGQDISFANGEYKPGTMEGDALLAHELAHTEQQKDAAAVQKKEKGGGNESAYEQEADDVAVGAAGKIWGKTESWASEMGGKTKTGMKTGLKLQACNTSTTPENKKDSLKQDSVKQDTTSAKSFNTMVPSFADIGKTSYRDLQSIKTWLNNAGFVLGGDYKSIMKYSDLKWNLMNTSEFVEFAYGGWYLSYEEAINACAMKLFDLMKGNTVKSTADYSKLAVKTASYEEELYTALTSSTDPQKNTESLIKTNTKIWNAVKNIETELAATADKDLSVFVETKGKLLWESSRGKDSDKPIYWARIKFKKALRDRVTDAQQLKNLFRVLDDNSRGVTDVKFDKADKSNGAIKKVIVTGFDPFQGGTSNPSGIVAQKMDGIILTSGGKDIAEVQVMTFPNSYTEFDKQVVEKALGQYISGDNAVYMVMTISLDNSAEEMYLERYAANTRAGHDDNEKIERYLPEEELLNVGIVYTQPQLSSIVQRISGQITEFRKQSPGLIGPTPPATYSTQSVNAYIISYNTWLRNYPRKPLLSQSGFPFSNTPEFIESNFPMGEMMKTTTPPANMTIRQNYSYFLSEASPYNTSPNTSAYPDVVKPGANALAQFNAFPPATGIKSISGPGGDYFSNEIYYRVSWLRQSSNSPVKNIHLHIPDVGNAIAGKTGQKYKIGDIYSRAKDILTLGVKTQMDIDAQKVK